MKHQFRCSINLDVASGMHIRGCATPMMTLAVPLYCRWFQSSQCVTPLNTPDVTDRARYVPKYKHAVPHIVPGTALLVSTYERQEGV